MVFIFNSCDVGLISTIIYAAEGVRLTVDGTEYTKPLNNWTQKDKKFLEDKK